MGVYSDVGVKKKNTRTQKHKCTNKKSLGTNATILTLNMKRPNNKTKYPSHNHIHSRLAMQKINVAKKSHAKQQQRGCNNSQLY